MKGDRELRPYHYKKERKRFACISYTITVAFLLLAIGQWCLFYWVDSILKFFEKYTWVGIPFFSLGLIFILIFIFIDKLRFLTPLNWIIGFVIFECIVVGVSVLIVRHYKYHFVVSFVIWSLVLALFIIIGSFIPYDLTLDIVVIVIFALVSLVGAIYFLMLHIVANVPYTSFVYRAFIVFSIILFIMYHAQIINGGRFAEIRDRDYVLAALMLFFDFLLMYLFTFQMAPKWSDDCDSQRNNNNQLPFVKTIQTLKTVT